MASAARPPFRQRSGMEGVRLDPSPSLRRRWRLAGIAGLIFALVGLAACRTVADDAAVDDEEAPAEVGLEPQRGGSLRVGAGDGIPADYFAGNQLGRQVSTLVQFAWPLFLPSGEPEPMNALAQAYEASPDGLIHTFTLRSGLTFHDGSPLDAEAVAENFRSHFDEDHPLRDEGPYLTTLAFLEDGRFGSPTVVGSIDVIDDLTVQMTLTKPRVDLRRALWHMYIMNPAIMAQPDYGTDVEALRDAGSGPFRVTRFEPETFIEFERFDGFFEEVYLERLRWEVIPDQASLALALRGGEVDVAFQLAQADHDTLVADPSFTEYLSTRPWNNMYIFLQMTQPAMEDPRVREAVWLALDREAYVNTFFSAGTAFTSTQPVVVPDTHGYNPDLEERPHDPDRARELLAEAGVENLTLKAIGTPFFSALSNVRQFWEAVAADLDAVGINLEITITDSATLAAEQANNDMRLAPYDYEDEFLVFPLFFTSLGAVEPPDPRATNPDVARLLTAAGETADAEEQAAIFHELMRLNHEELMMGIPLARVVKSAIARQEVRDLRVISAADPQHGTWIDQS